MTVVERREPEQVLLDLLYDADVTLQKLKSELATAGVSGPLLAAWGEWADRTGRIGKIVIDGELENRLEARRTRRIEWEASSRASMTQGLWIAATRMVELPAGAKLLFWDALYAAMSQAQELQELPRADGPEVQGFRRELERGAAEERAAAVEPLEVDVEEGDDSEFDNIAILFPRGDGAA